MPGRWLERARGRLGSLGDAGGRQGRWVLLDQGVVSGVNFLTGIVLARQLGPEVFGSYVLLQAVLLYVNSWQGALIFQPMLSAAPPLAPGPRAAYLGGMFAVQLGLAGGLAVLTLVLGLSLALLAQLLPGLPPFGPGAWLTVPALAAALFAYQMLDWQRRCLFVHGTPRRVLGLDLLCGAVQLTLLGLLAGVERLGVGSALACQALGSAAAALLAWRVSPVRPARAELATVLRASWRHSRDYLAAWQLQWVGSQGVLVVGAGLIGPQAAGGVRAAQNIVGPINILFQAMENLVPIAAARRHAEGGMAALSAYLLRLAGWGSALLLPLLAVLALWAEPLTRLLYGERYAGYAALVVWQGLSLFLQYHLRLAFFFLRTLQATGAILRAGALMAGCAVLVAVLTVREHQATGLMLAFLTAYAVALVYALDTVRRLRAARGLAGALAAGGPAR